MNENDLKDHSLERRASMPAEQLPAVAAAPVTVVDDEPLPKNMVVVARNPQQMMVAQARLVAWATRKVAEAKEDHKDLDENLEVATRNGWRRSTLERQTKKALGRVKFYEKVLAALDAGYVIIPNFDIDVFAIRTKRSGPMRNEVHGNWAMPDLQKTEILPEGAGRYVSSAAEVRDQLMVMKRNEKGVPTETERYAWADEFREVDFPFAAAKPEILNATAEALALKIFDDIGVSPRAGTLAQGRPSVKGDPMVIGRVLLKESTYRHRAISFLIAWFVDTKDL